MSRRRPARLIASGAALAVLGWVLPFLMVLRVVEPSLGLAFLSYAALLAGTLMGVIGAVQWRVGRPEDGPSDDQE